MKIKLHNAIFIALTMLNHAHLSSACDVVGCSQKFNVGASNLAYGEWLPFAMDGDIYQSTDVDTVLASEYNTLDPVDAYDMIQMLSSEIYAIQVRDHPC